MGHTADPKRFWRKTRLCLMPSLWWENQPLVAIEAMINGIPVIGSDRGGIPEALGRSGVILPLPERLTPETRLLSTPEEVSPWVEAVIRVWDDPQLDADLSRRSLAEATRWDQRELATCYAEFFSAIPCRPEPDPLKNRE
jgi:glycosyltransferase involved in cell wall biosynthesis